MENGKKKPQIVVITGASGGVGRATARAFADRGAHIALLARGQDGLEGAKRDVEERGGKAIVIVTDVSKHKQVDAAAEQAERELGEIDVWVNNAMVSEYAPVWEITPDEYRHITEVTYLGQVYGTMAALKYMMPRNRGVIVHVGSALAHRSIPLQSGYCGAKHAIYGFMESLRCELIHKKINVHVTMVSLPGVNTTQFSWTRNKMPKKPQPVGPIFQPEIAADAIVFATHAHRKEILLGFPTVEAVLGERVNSEVLDHYIADTAWNGAQRPEDADPDAPNNFWHPLPGDHGAHGPFDDRAKTFSSQLWMNKNRKGIAAVALGAAMLTGAAVLLGKRNV